MISIAIDGPVGAGKSSIATAVAKHLGILHLDTGAMYRAVGLGVMEAGGDLADEERVVAFCRAGGAVVDVRYENGAQVTLLNGEDVSERIHTQTVGTAASTVSRYRAVREMMVARQREIAATCSMLMDGRDIGTVVLPDATLKIYLTASPEARARRRLNQLLDHGETAELADILREVNERDAQDMGRKVDPLRRAADAVLVDSTEMTFDETVQAIVRLAEARE